MHNHLHNNLELSAQKSDMLLSSEPSLNLTFNHTREQLLLASGAATQVLPPHQLSQAQSSYREERSSAQGGNAQAPQSRISKGEGKGSRLRDPAKGNRGRHGRKRSRDA